MLLQEAIRSKDFSRAANLIQKYLRKHIGSKVYFFPLPELVLSHGGKVAGIRYFFGGSKSFRLNWASIGTVGSNAVTSMDYWDGSMMPQPKPTTHVRFDEAQSLVKILPFLVDFLTDKVKASGVYVTESVATEHRVLVTDFTQAQSINEAAYTSGDLSHTVSKMLTDLRKGIQFVDQNKAGGNKHYGPRWNKAVGAVSALYPQFVEKNGNKHFVDPKNAMKIDPAKILAHISGGDDAVKFTIGAGAPETPIVDGTDDADVERMTYEEQLESLRTGMKLLMSNATNALFLGGRGGTGKTQTVEDMLHAAGLSDGNGYYKVTGSATPPGIYRVLFTHKTDVLLFDDSDGALADQDGRNLFKTASDTKKKRKISWEKGGKNYVDPDDFDEEADDGTLPRNFEFTGKIIFISNLPLNKLDPDGALRTRGYVISIDPTNDEIHDFMKKIANKIPLDVDHPLSEAERLEVVDVLKARKMGEKTANLRSLVRGLNTRAGVEKQGGSQAEWIKFVKMFA
jgi:hypothetical protein